MVASLKQVFSALSRKGNVSLAGMYWAYPMAECPLRLIPLGPSPK